MVVGADGRASDATDVPVADGPMMHDFALTERYVVPCDLPVTFSCAPAAAGAQLPYAWNLAHPLRVGLLAWEGARRSPGRGLGADH